MFQNNPASKITTEICVETPQAALLAAREGADRIELNSALCAGGLSPSLVVLDQIISQFQKQDLSCSVICMVRLQTGGFVVDDQTFSLMKEEARLFLEHGAKGIAFGFLCIDGSIDWPKTRQMCDWIHQHHGEAVFHRAFDLCPDPFGALEQLIQAGVDRILTSGQAHQAPSGAPLLKELHQLAGGRIELIGGCGLNGDNVRGFLQESHLDQVHASCLAPVADMGCRSETVDFSASPSASGMKNVISLSGLRSFLKNARQSEVSAQGDGRAKIL